MRKIPVPSGDHQENPIVIKEVRQVPIGSFAKGHDWFRPHFTLDNHTFVHRHCQTCGRDFAMDVDEKVWRAVHVGRCCLDALSDETTQRRILEDCPGRKLQGEENDERIPLIATKTLAATEIQRSDRG